MRKKRFLSGLAINVMMFGMAEAGPIAIETAAISDLSDYINNPLFSPYFGTTSTTIINFEGPWSPPDTINNYFNLGAVGYTYNSLGINFGAGDTFMGGQPGFGYVTPNTVVGNAGYPYDGPINIEVVIPGTNIPGKVMSIGAFVADGPTNDTTAWFYDINNNLLGSVLANPNSNMFLGWSDPIGISRMIFTNGNGDDYYIDNLTFTTPSNPVPEPATMLLLGTGLAGLAGTRLRRKK